MSSRIKLNGRSISSKNLAKEVKKDLEKFVKDTIKKEQGKTKP